MQYELFYLIGAKSEADLEKIKKSAEDIVTEEGGVFQEKITTEKRRLSYEVKHETHGIYVARRFELEDSEKLKDITRKLNLNTAILRFILSRADELPPLKSKEERMSEAQNIEKRAQEVKKEKIIEKKKEEKKEEKDGDKPKDEDIDKQLEDILNI